MTPPTSGRVADGRGQAGFGPGGWVAGAGIARYRPPQARLAVAYSTKDRTELTRRTVAPLLAAADIDLYWFDGSATEAGQRLPSALCADSPAICEVHYGVTGGPDFAILHALRLLRPLRYELVLLVENDVLLTAGWQAALHDCMSAAHAAGFQVGGASLRVVDQRVLSFNATYCLLLNAGAGCIALTPPALDIVVENYRTTDSDELIRQYRALTGIDVAETVQFPLGQMCSADCLYDLLLYLHGFVVAAPPVSFAQNVNPEDGPLQRGAIVVSDAGQHLAQLHGALTRPDQLRLPVEPFCRFQRSQFSGRLLVACHQLDLAVGPGEPPARVRLEGSWRPRWLQMLGPFSLAGTGRIRLPVLGASIGVLLFSGQAPVELVLTGPDGYRATSAMKPNTVVEFALEAAQFGMQDAVLSVLAGEVSLVGVTAEASLVGYYAALRGRR
jgi:hypothetical protein